MIMIRKILFYIFLLIYLVLCPMIILYALGIQISPHHQALIKTGVIALATSPSGADVFINEVLYAEKTPTVIRDLPSGQSVSLRVTLKGYSPYQKTLPIEAEKAIVLEHILLIPEQWESQQRGTARFRELLPLTGPFLLLANGPLVKDYFVLNLKAGISEMIGIEMGELTPPILPAPLSADSLKYSDHKVKRLFTAPESTLVLCEVSGPGPDEFLLFDIGNNESAPMRITDLFPSPPQDVQWAPQLRHVFFSLQGNRINKIDVSAKALYPNMISSISAFHLADNTIFALLSDRKFISLDFDGKTKGVLFNFHGVAQDALAKTPVFIAMLKKNIFIFKNSLGDIFSNLQPDIILARHVRGTAVDRPNERMAFWTKNKIGYLEAWPEKHRPGSPGARLRATWLPVNLNNIRQVFWVNDGGYLLCLDSNRVVLIEVTPYPDPDEAEVVRVQKNSRMYFSNQTGELFFLHPDTSALFSINMIPERTLLPEELTEHNRNLQDTTKP